jgi:hypothetical protein
MNSKGLFYLLLIYTRIFIIYYAVQTTFFLLEK